MRPSGAAPRRARVLAVTAIWMLGAAIAAGCSSDESVVTTTSTTDPVVVQECVPADPPLLVGQIGDAVAAVEAELGGPQRYFEVNATAVEVTVIVADDAAGTATPFRFRDGRLIAGDPLEGSGLSFTAEQLTFDPRRVISCVAAQLPTSTLGMFYVLATEAGGVRRAVLVSSAAGGQLEAEVGDDGTIVGVDPVGDSAPTAASDPATTAG